MVLFIFLNWLSLLDIITYCYHYYHYYYIPSSLSNTLLLLLLIPLLGVALRELSGSLFIDLVNELKVLNNPNMPVLIAVDEYNTWELPSAFAYNNQAIHAKQLCVPHILNFLTPRQADSENWSLANGMCIGELLILLILSFVIDWVLQ